MPENIGEEYMNDLMREIISRNIIFVNKKNSNAEEDSILDKYKVLVAYFKKPLNSHI